MKLPVRYTNEAAANLESVIAWLTQPGAGARAARRLDHIITAIERLGDHPRLHPEIRSGTHEFSIEGHRVRYRIAPDAVEILRIFGPGQQRDV